MRPTSSQMTRARERVRGLMVQARETEARLRALAASTDPAIAAVAVAELSRLGEFAEGLTGAVGITLH